MTAATMTITIRQLTPVFGAEVTGVDLKVRHVSVISNGR